MKGCNSCKNESIKPKRELEQWLLITKQYTQFQSYGCKNGEKSPENWKNLKFC
jgi:hypothetical protein